MLNISRRPARQRDQDLLYNIKSHSLKSYLNETQGWDEEMQRRVHAQHFDPNLITIIRCNHSDIGYLEKRLLPDNVVFIENLLIHKDFQNQGIGRRIMTEEINTAQKENYHIQLQVLKNNPKALRFYQSLGFAAISNNSSHFLMQI